MTITINLDFDNKTFGDWNLVLSMCETFFFLNKEVKHLLEKEKWKIFFKNEMKIIFNARKFFFVNH